MRKRLRKHSRKRPARTNTRLRLSVAARLRLALPLLSLVSLLALALLSCGHADVGLLAMGLPMMAQLTETELPDVSPDPASAPATPQALRLTVLESESKPAAQVPQPGSTAPTILIYHTHTTEAYAQTTGYTYTPRGSWRTTDNDKNIVAVGELLAKLLREYGFSVIHDTTNHEPPKLATSYTRSEQTMRSYKTKYPSLSVFIDVHRDAYGNSDTPITDYIEIGGKEVARLMFVVGTGKGATGTGFAEMPDYDSNHALAEAITNRLAAVDGRLARPIRVKTGRYNQHISSSCLLVEVGHNCNTLDQALAAIPYLAEAIAGSLGENVQSAAALKNKDSSVWSPEA